VVVCWSRFQKRGGCLLGYFYLISTLKSPGFKYFQMVVLLVVLGGLLMVALREKFVSQKSHKCLGNGWW